MTFDTKAAREKAAEANALISALCEPKGAPGAREWLMSIPANPRDPDLVMSAAALALIHACDEVERLRAEKARLESEVDTARDNIREAYERGISDGHPLGTRRGVADLTAPGDGGG